MKIVHEIGNVVLTDLQLKKEALDKLNLPIEVFFGTDACIAKK